MKSRLLPLVLPQVVAGFAQVVRVMADRTGHEAQLFLVPVHVPFHVVQLSRLFPHVRLLFFCVLPALLTDCGAHATWSFGHLRHVVPASPVSPSELWIPGYRPSVQTNPGCVSKPPLLRLLNSQLPQLRDGLQQLPHDVRERLSLIP